MNSNWFFAGDLAWRLPSALACLLLTALIVWLELRRKNRNTVFRIVLSFLAILALLLSVWQPAYRQVLGGEEAVLLTPNASQQSLDSLLDKNSALKIYTLEKQQERGEYLPHTSYLPPVLASGSRLLIFGDGPPPASLPHLDAYEVKFLAGKRKEGLRSLSFSAYLQKGDPLLVSGSWASGKDTVSIKLSLAGKLLDSAMVYPESELFLLRHSPKLSGSLHYQLLAEGINKDTLEHIILPIEVQENQPLRIALFTGYPSFESKYLKNWLAEQGHSVFYQAEMAPDRYVREWLNLPDKNLQGLNKKLLNQVDLLLVDQSYLTDLSQPNQELIEEAVKEGMGLLALADGTSLNLRRQVWEQLPTLQLSGRIREKKLLAGNNVTRSATFQHYEAEGPDWVRETEQAEGVGFLHVPYGLGNFGISLLLETYPLLLQSSEEAYEQQWTFLLNKTVGNAASGKLLSAGFPAIKGQRHELVAWQTEKKEPQLVLTEPNGQKQVLALIQDSRVPERWVAYHWPKEEGIYRLNWPETDSLSFQVLNTAALPAWQQHEKKEGLQAFIANQEKENKQESSAEIQKRNMGYHEQMVPLYWFYLLFLVCLTGLWVERKIHTP
jgi:hypothetical protein